MKKLILVLIGVVFLAGGVSLALDYVYSANLNFTLYRNEAYWGGSKQAELLSFLEGARRVSRAQARLTAKNDNEIGRVFHRKQLGCLTGKLKLLNDRPLDVNHVTDQGLFDPTKKNSYDLIARFSNGLGIVNADRAGDVRGVALKIFDVTNSRTGKGQAIDFLMTNFPTPFGRDFLEFAAFMDKVSKFPPMLGTAFFAATHPPAGLAIVKAAGLLDYDTLSVATVRYWSGHAYLLGENAAMKFSLIPEKFENLSKNQVKAMGDNFLRGDLLQRTQRTPLKFILAVQLEKNAAVTPIEDNLHEWLEKDSPFIPVGEVVFDQQDFSHAQIDSQCEKMRFTPAHYIPEHRPLSNLGRGRLFGYEASQMGRHADAVEPTTALVEEWRKINRVAH